MLNNYSLNRILCLFASIGFLFLAVDSAIEHRDVLLKEPMSLVPVLFGALGAAIALIAILKWNESWIRILHMFLLVGFLVAGTGVYLHVREDDDEEKAAVKTEQQEKEKPILAPLAFAGVALVGLLGTSRKWQAEQSVKQA